MFGTVLEKGLPNGTKKDTTLTFDTSGGVLALHVNGKHVGSVSSPPLTRAFKEVYLDDEAVVKLVAIKEDHIKAPAL
ncbi:hypothetical protein M885DRAFT_526864 [Pelagophyceae sp. CCMP2097]|nr:hypothetical protein M885DRAFT_526864 [Pelagophyceae sp. CCMP2097]